MRYSVTSVILPDLDLAEQRHLLQSCGYEGLEHRVPELTNSRRTRMCLVSRCRRRQFLISASLAAAVVAGYVAYTSCRSGQSWDSRKTSSRDRRSDDYEVVGSEQSHGKIFADKDLLERLGPPDHKVQLNEAAAFFATQPGCGPEWIARTMTRLAGPLYGKASPSGEIWLYHWDQPDRASSEGFFYRKTLRGGLSGCFVIQDGFVKDYCPLSRK